MHTIDLRGRTHTSAELLALVPRAAVDVAVASEAASALIDEVRSGGSEALLAQADRFDGGRPPALRVPASEIAEAIANLDPAVRRALEETIRRVRLASSAQVPQNTVTEIAPGARIRQRWQPIARVGLYVPGGKAVYPSSVVMNVVPAQVAGVSSIALVSPPQRDHGSHVHPVVLAAAGLLGIDEVYAMGGAGAIGALAYGVDELGLEPVQLVTGPGNVYVAAAKRLIRGQAGIDSEAGPTDILVIADAAADARLVAADLISQAEHDELAAAVLVTDSAEFADAVVVEVERQVALTTHRDRVTAALTGEQSAVVLVDDLRAAAAFSNAFGPEHLEIQTTDAEAVLADIQNAGAIFLGPNSPVSLGDYAAGSNHVLPTGGQARFAAGLNAATFLRSQQVVEYSRKGLAEVAETIAALSATEALPAHGDAVVARFS
ncbi:MULTISPECIES: histidinol dehydrogenase [unclassified Leifsonia]|uniref:histidinol dehydrogenase n=1 Tax=unclassified Leifsonia TaxID=2663824 RepID=UPI0006FC542F|nr:MULTISPECIES: histidinol dehydrogenase [unclassified Leifsonia]KQX06729.1 histidinol dehydrogenase [Leifsonia sp. Root1293]KRA11013.1 histidinol dehydrogenase [Leifsonia sp. Root60]